MTDDEALAILAKYPVGGSLDSATNLLGTKLWGERQAPFLPIVSDPQLTPETLRAAFERLTAVVVLPRAENESLRPPRRINLGWRELCVLTEFATNPSAPADCVAGMVAIACGPGQVGPQIGAEAGSCTRSTLARELLDRADLSNESRQELGLADCIKVRRAALEHGGLAPSTIRDAVNMALRHGQAGGEAAGDATDYLKSAIESEDTPDFVLQLLMERLPDLATLHQVLTPLYQSPRTLPFIRSVDPVLAGPYEGARGLVANPGLADPKHSGLLRAIYANGDRDTRYALAHRDDLPRWLYRYLRWDYRSVDRETRRAAKDQLRRHKRKH